MARISTANSATDRGHLSADIGLRELVTLYGLTQPAMNLQPSAFSVRSLNELSRLSDRELADIGISRCDIPRVAWNAAQER